MFGFLRRKPAPLPDLAALILWRHPRGWLVQPHYITLRDDLAPSGEVGFAPDPAQLLPPDVDDAGLGAACLTGLSHSRPLDPKSPSDQAILSDRMGPDAYAAYSSQFRTALGIGPKAALYSAMSAASLRAADGQMRAQAMQNAGQGGFTAEGDPQIHPRIDDPATLGAWLRSFTG